LIYTLALWPHMAYERYGAQWSILRSYECGAVVTTLSKILLLSKSQTEHWPVFAAQATALCGLGTTKAATQITQRKQVHLCSLG